jgi:hypothetical protein
MNGNEYEAAIRRYVCSRCIDFGADGLCHSKDPQGCAIYRFLPELIRIAEGPDDPSMESYLRAVREDICSHCREALTWPCPLRTSADCALDRYLPLVIEAVAEVGKGENREGFQGDGYAGAA